MPAGGWSLLLLCLAVVSWANYVPVIEGDTCGCLKLAALPDYNRHVLNCTSIGGKLVCPGALTEPLFRSILVLNVTGVKAALALGADVNATSSYEPIRGLTPVQVALLSTSEPLWHLYTEGVYVIIKVLLDAHADPNTPFPQGTYRGSQECAGMTPLQYVAHDGRLLLVKLFIKAGADMTAHGRGGRTALHDAAKCPISVYTGEQLNVPNPAPVDADYTEVMIALLRAGADLHAMDDNGNMPIHLAPDYTTDCEGSSMRGTTCGEVCQIARDGFTIWQERFYLTSQYTAPGPVRKGDCCSDPDVDQSGLKHSKCCLAPNGLLNVTV